MQSLHFRTSQTCLISMVCSQGIHVTCFLKSEMPARLKHKMGMQSDPLTDRRAKPPPQLNILFSGTCLASYDVSIHMRNFNIDPCRD